MIRSLLWGAAIAATLGRLQFCTAKKCRGLLLYNIGLSPGLSVCRTISNYQLASYPTKTLERRRTKKYMVSHTGPCVISSTCSCPRSLNAIDN